MEKAFQLGIALVLVAPIVAARSALPSKVYVMTAGSDEIRFEKATGTIGAFVHGAKLGELDAAAGEKLRRALHEHGVLFFDFGRSLPQGDYRAFASLFGEVEKSRFTSGKGGTPYIDSEVVPMQEYRVNYWHSDQTPFEHPPQAAVLQAIELPEAGGDTMWASMYAAYESLSSHMQRMLDGLQVLHSTVRTPFVREPAKFVHPAVIRDGVTGRKMLFVNSNYSERFVDMSERESDELMRFLFQHINTPEFHVRCRWKIGKIAVWENRVTQHRGVADFTGPRKLQRLTILGERPVA